MSRAKCDQDRTYRVLATTAAAIADINAKQGQAFAIGLRNLSIGGQNDAVFSGSGFNSGNQLILEGNTPLLAVTPAPDFTAAGSIGGPFAVATPPSGQYTVQNTGAGTLNWTVSGPSWLMFSPASGSLGTGASQVVTVSVNATANAFAAGTQSGTITFGGNGGTATRTATLTVDKGNTATTITSDTPDPKQRFEA